MRVYLLRDPRTGQTRYVGHAIDPHRRVIIDLSRARTSTDRSSRFLSWLRELIRLDLRPEVEIVRSTSRASAIDDKAAVIDAQLAAGARLTNDRLIRHRGVRRSPRPPSDQVDVATLVYRRRLLERDPNLPSRG